MQIPRQFILSSDVMQTSLRFLLRTGRRLQQSPWFRTVRMVVGCNFVRIVFHTFTVPSRLILGISRITFSLTFGLVELQTTQYDTFYDLVHYIVVRFTFAA